MIIVGLGNPGMQYQQTRHNAGFLFLEAACRRWRGGPWVNRRCFRENQIRVAGGEHRLVAPTTYMNRSGDAVRILLAQGARAGDLAVVLDDVELALGRIRIRPRGGAGGHNGLQSILDVVGNQEVARMRLGVGRPDLAGSMTDHVLGPFDAADGARFEQVLERALDALHVILKQGITAAMNRFNGLPAPWEGPETSEPDRIGGLAPSDPQSGCVDSNRGVTKDGRSSDDNGPGGHRGGSAFPGDRAGGRSGEGTAEGSGF